MRKDDVWRLHSPSTVRISPTSCERSVLLLWWRQLSHLFPRKVYHHQRLDAMEIKATNWTIPDLSNVHLGISRNEFTARHTRCTCRCNLMQSRCVIDSNLRRHAFKLHEAFMLIARDLRFEPIAFFVSLVKMCLTFAFATDHGWEKLIRSTQRTRTKENRKGFQLAVAIIVVAKWRCCKRWYNIISFFFLFLSEING